MNQPLCLQKIVVHTNRGTERLGNDSYVVSTLAPFAQEAVKVLSDAAKFVVDTNCKNKTVVCDDADAYKVGECCCKYILRSLKLKSMLNVHISTNSVTKLQIS